jgi:hypothetical protein
MARFYSISAKRTAPNEYLTALYAHLERYIKENWIVGISDRITHSCNVYEYEYDSRSMPHLIFRYWCARHKSILCYIDIDIHKAVHVDTTGLTNEIVGRVDWTDPDMVTTIEHWIQQWTQVL